MSTLGVARTRAAAPSSVEASANTKLTRAPPEARMLSTARSSFALLRPVMITVAPSTASLRAISRPMPAVERVMRAVLSFSCRSMMVSPSVAQRRWALPKPSAVADFGLDRLALAQGERALQHIAGDRILAQERDARPAPGVGEKGIPGLHHLRRSADAVVRAHRHHAAPPAGFVVELVEVQLDLRQKLLRRVVPSFDQDNVVVAQRVGNNDEILAVDLLDERLVTADIVDVIEVAELLQQRQGIGTATQPIGVVAERALPGDLFHHIARRDQELPLVIAAHRELRAPARTMTGCLVATRDDLLGKRRMILGRLADHMGGDLDAVSIPQVEQAGNALAGPAGAPCVGDAARGGATGNVELWGCARSP